MEELIATIVTAITSLTTIIFAIVTYLKENKIKKLEEEISYLKRKVHRVTSKVSPDSDLRLIKEAHTDVKILGINGLAPIHHCREELIDLLRHRNSTLKIILLNPNSDAFRRREEFEKDKTGRIYSEWIASINILKDIEISSDRSFQIGLRSDDPDRSLLIIDTDRELSISSKMLINYYPEIEGMRGYSGGQFLSEYLLEKDRDSFYKNLHYYDELWLKIPKYNLDNLISNMTK